MIILRPFTPADYPAYAAYNPQITPDIYERYLSQWNTRSHNGRYFEMFAVVAKSALVGFCSLAETPEGYISEGIEIYPPYRRRGYAREAVDALLLHAATLGYRQVYAQIRTNNLPSLLLHENLGFSRVGVPFLNKHHREVVLLVHEFINET